MKSVATVLLQCKRGKADWLPPAGQRSDQLIASRQLSSPSSHVKEQIVFNQATWH
jgi:hypothetical protein